MFLFNLFLLLAAVTVSSTVIFEDCGSAYELEEVSIEGCGMRQPCYVTLGEQVPVNIKFYADFVSLKLDQEVVININFINLRTNVTPEACETVDCPVRTDAATSFTSVMTVPTNIALNQRGYLRWRVYNERGRLVLCYAVLVQTQSPLQKLLRDYRDATLSQPERISSGFDVLDASHTDRNKINATNVSFLENNVKQR